MRSWIALALVSAAAALAPVTSTAAATRPDARSPRHPLAESKTWRSLVEDAANPIVYPRAVSVSGPGVENPDGLRDQGGTITTIHATGAGDPTLTLDLGANVGGYVEVGVTKSDGTTARLGYSEARRFLTPDGDTAADSLGADDAPGARYDDVSKAGDFRSPGIRGAQRWISLRLQGPGTVAIDYVRVRREHLQPALADYQGHFYSSDPVLNRAWYAGVYTFALGAYRDMRPGRAGSPVVITDGAKRDRLVWLGDLAIENELGAYSLRQAPAIIRDSLALFACQQRPSGELQMASEIDARCPGGSSETNPAIAKGELPEYTAWWIAALRDYRQFSGDDDFARSMLPVVRRAIGYFDANLEDDVFVTRGAAINWHPFDMAQGRDSHTNATWYRALTGAAQLELQLGSREQARADYARATRLRVAMLRTLWDPAAGAFFLNADEPDHQHSQDAQVEAVLDGVVGGAQATSALKFIDDHLETRYGVKNAERDDSPYISNYISPYISSTELLARLSVGDTGGALSLLRRLWGHMLATDPGDTLWEKMTFAGDAASYDPGQLGAGVIPNNTPFAGAGTTSLAHGWSGGPVPALSGYVLGIRPLAVAYRTWIVAPQPGDLRFAQGRAPTPHGPISSRWRHSARSFVLTVRAPKATAGAVVVPTLGHRRAIAMDGRLVWTGTRVTGGARRVHARAQAGGVRFTAVRGGHTFAWAGR